VEALEGSSVIASTIRLLSFERRPPVVHWRSATRAKTTTGPRAHGGSKHDELAAAGLSPGEIRGADHNNMRGTHFYCTAPGNVLVEIAKPPKR
jgi:hypothetical protein